MYNQGDIVYINGYIEKRRKEAPSDVEESLYTEWHEVNLATPLKVMIVGRTHKKNGKFFPSSFSGSLERPEGYIVPSYFACTNSIESYVVVEITKNGLYRAQITVLPSQILNNGEVA